MHEILTIFQFFAGYCCTHLRMMVASRNQYEKGAKIADIARQPGVRYSPYLMARILVEVLETGTGGYHMGHVTSSFSCRRTLKLDIPTLPQGESIVSRVVNPYLPLRTSWAGRETLRSVFNPLFLSVFPFFLALPLVSQETFYALIAKVSPRNIFVEHL